MDWYPQQLFTAGQAAAGGFVLKKDTLLFGEWLFWSPQAMLTAEQVAAGASFSEKGHAVLGKMC